MDAIVIQNAAGDERLVTEDLRSLLRTLGPVAHSLECSSELEFIQAIIDRGASYQRQLRPAEANNGSLKAVVSSLVREMREGEPHWTAGSM